MKTVDDRALAAVLDEQPTRWSAPEGSRSAAVLVPIVRRGNVDRLIYTVRPDTMPTHSSQVAFPGGRREPNETPGECALREATEELGVVASGFDLVGGLPDRSASAGFHVEVCVARLSPDLPMAPSTHEVAAVFEVPLPDLLDAARWRLALPPPPSTYDRPVPQLPWEGHVVWGFTARVTMDLIQRLRPDWRLESRL